MLARDLKIRLNVNLILKILEKIGCHNIYNNRSHISAAMPDGDNPTSVCVYIDGDGYNAEVFTRPKFKQRKHRDIIELVSFIKDISFAQAIKEICDICGFDFYSTKNKGENKLLKSLAFWEGKHTKSDNEIEDKPISESIYNNYIMMPITKWLQEGIKYESQMEFKIGFDLESKRIIIPIYNNINELVGIKGRLLKEEDVENNNKYIYLLPCQKSKMLFGLGKNYNEIIKKNCVIIVESEKSVIKLHGYGYKNVISLAGKTASEDQIYEILRLGVDNVILCLDKDVSEEEIELFAKNLNNPIKTCNLFIMRDPLGLMTDEKESPTDNMDTWEALYDNYLEKYE